MNDSAIKKLCVSGSALTDTSGHPVRLFGMSTHGLAWHPEVICEEAFDSVKYEFHHNCIRLALYTSEYGGYCTSGNKAELMSLLEKGIDLAVKRDMYVIIDWHTLSDNDPNIYKKEAKEFFGILSEKYHALPNVIYEICNEPNGSCTWDDIYEYSLSVIPVIRKNSDGLVLVGTPQWSQIPAAALKRLLPYDNIMYTCHFYAATHGEGIRQNLLEAVNGGLPVFVSEFNICDAFGDGPANMESAEKWLNILETYDLSRICWNLSARPNTSAVIRAGSEIKRWTDADLKDDSLWLMKHFLHEKL